MFAIKNFFAIWRLVRFEHAFMFALAVFIAELITAQGMILFTPVIIFSLLVPIFSEMAAFAMNDLLDIETDKLNRKTERPLVSNELSPNFALALTVISFLFALFFASLVSPLVFMLALVINIFAILYNIVLKDLPLFGNIYIALTMGIPFIFGNYVISEVLNPLNLLFAVLGFIVGLGREIVKTVEDIKGDKKARKSQTLPLLIGEEKSLIIAGILYSLFIVLSAVPYYYYLKIGSGFILVLIADAIFLYLSVIFLFSKRRMVFLKTARKLSLAGLAFGLAGILVSMLAG